MCAKTTGNLTAAEWQQYGSPAVAPMAVCRSAQPSGPGRALAGSSVGSDPGLTSATGSAVTRRQGTCADLISGSGVTCGLFGNGYAWTIAPVKLGVKVTVYQDNGTVWQPVLATPKAMQVVEADVVPFSDPGRGPALAVWQVNTADGSGNDLSLVEGGRVVWDQEGNFDSVRPEKSGLRLWTSVYNSGDPVCCPSGHLTELLVRAPSGRWVTEGQTAVSEGSIPRMSATS